MSTGSVTGCYSDLDKDRVAKLNKMAGEMTASNKFKPKCRAMCLFATADSCV